MSGKLSVQVDQLSFPLDADCCKLSEVLKKEFDLRVEKDDFSEPHILPLPKRLLPMVVAYLSTYKLKLSSEAAFNPIPEDKKLESTLPPFKKLVSGLEINSEEFIALANFQRTYKFQGLDDLLALYIFSQTAGKTDKDLSDALGMTYDGFTFDDDRKTLIEYAIDQSN